MHGRVVLCVFVTLTSLGVCTVANDVPVINVSKPKEPSKLQTAMDRIETLETMVNTYIREVDTLRAEKVKLTKTVGRLKAKNKKMGGGDKEPQIDHQLEAEQAEEYFRRETGQLAQEMHKLNRERHDLERQLADCQQQTTGCGNARQQQTNSDLREKLDNCDATVTAVRQRCADDQDLLRQTTDELAGVRKECGNCSAELKDCENMKSYLEFLKRGYEVVVPDLENEAKEAKENKQKSENEAENAFKVAASARLYLAMFCVVLSIFGSFKFYAYVAGVVQQRQKMAEAAKAEQKHSKRKRK